MSVSDRLERDPKLWKPEPGDRLVGRLLERVEEHGEFGQYPVLIIIDDLGVEWEVRCGVAVLRSELDKHKPQPGDSVGLRYDGTHPDKGYHQYRFVVERPQPETKPPSGTDPF